MSGQSSISSTTDWFPPATQREPTEILEAIQLDVALGLSVLLSPVDGSIDDAFNTDSEVGRILENDIASAVVWTFDGVHTQSPVRSDGSPILEPTGLAVRVAGVTVVTGDPGSREFRRYVDWADVYAQLGMPVTMRPRV
jgi:hypothetical protein